MTIGNSPNRQHMFRSEIECIQAISSSNPARHNVFHSLIGHLHDDIILLLRPESFRVLLSSANQSFCYLNLTGMTKFKYERKNEMNSGCSSKMMPQCLLLYFKRCIDLLPIDKLGYSKSPYFLCCDRAWQSELQSGHSSNWVLAPFTHLNTRTPICQITPHRESA